MSEQAQESQVSGPLPETPRQPTKAKKGRAEKQARQFPLSLHQNGQWCREIRRRLCYFGGDGMVSPGEAGVAKESAGRPGSSTRFRDERGNRDGHGHTVIGRWSPGQHPKGPARLFGHAGSPHSPVGGWDALSSTDNSRPSGRRSALRGRIQAPAHAPPAQSFDRT